MTTMTTMTTRGTPTRRRAAAVAAASAAAVLCFAAPASAHVSVQPGTASQDSYAKVAFRVPNERDDAGTTRLEITLPADKPLTSVQTRAMPGWTATVEKTPLPQPIDNHGTRVTETVSKITWAAGEGVRINPGTFEEFEVSMGRLPADADQLVFKAVQTYDNGEVVRWIDLPGADGAEGEYPAPVLKLTPKGTSGGAPAPASSSGTGVTTTAAGTASPSGDTDDGTARTLGTVGIVVGVLGLGAGVFGGVRGSRRTPASTAQ